MLGLFATTNGIAYFEADFQVAPDEAMTPRSGGELCRLLATIPIADPEDEEAEPKILAFYEEFSKERTTEF